MSEQIHGYQPTFETEAKAAEVPEPEPLSREAALRALRERANYKGYIGVAESVALLAYIEQLESDYVSISRQYDRAIEAHKRELVELELKKQIAVEKARADAYERVMEMSRPAGSLSPHVFSQNRELTETPSRRG